MHVSDILAYTFAAVKNRSGVRRQCKLFGAHFDIFKSWCLLSRLLIYPRSRIFFESYKLIHGPGRTGSFFFEFPPFGGVHFVTLANEPRNWRATTILSQLYAFAARTEPVENIRFPNILELQMNEINQRYWVSFGLFVSSLFALVFVIFRSACLSSDYKTDGPLGGIRVDAVNARTFNSNDRRLHLSGWL